MCPIFIKLGIQSKSSMLIMNIIIGTDGLDPKLHIRQIWFQEWNVLQIFMKFSTYSKSSMLIVNIVLGIDDLDPKL